MPKACGNESENLRTIDGTICARPSTDSLCTHSMSSATWVKVPKTPHVVTFLFTELSTYISRRITLLVPQLYPLSTAPITSTTNFKKGEY